MPRIAHFPAWMFCNRAQLQPAGCPQVLTLAFLAIFLSLSTAVRAANAPQPNIVVIIADDVSAEDIGCFGNSAILTPNIDRLADGGMRFKNAYLTAASCSPSRCSILTGRYPHNLETAAELDAFLPPGIALFPKLLREVGYYTAQAGKYHLGGPIDGELAREAFDIAGDSRSIRGIRDEGGEGLWVERLQKRPPGKPFFMWFAAHDAHRKWNAGSFAGKNDPRNVRVPPYLVDTPETRRDLAAHFDEINRLDYHVGEVVAELTRQKVRDNTLIVFLADNGRPFPRSKTQLYDDGIKTPLILNWPAEIKRPATVESLVSSIDLTPTILELAGAPVPPTVQGVSLRPILRDPGMTIRDYVFAEKNWHNFPAHMRLVRTGGWVYLRNAWPELPQPGASDSFYNLSADALKAQHAHGRLTEAQANIFRVPRPTEELYDLKVDPAQMRNLAAEPRAREVLARLDAVLTRWQQETGDSVPANPTPANVDYATGQKLELRRGDAPGAATRARHINRPGPIRAGP